MIFKFLKDKEDVSYEKMPISILSVKKEKIMRNRLIPLVRMQKKQHSSEETVWELEEDMRHLYPSLIE